MDGMRKRTVAVQPAAGVGVMLLGVALLWLVPGVPEFVGIAAIVIGALVLVNEFA